MVVPQHYRGTSIHYIIYYIFGNYFGNCSEVAMMEELAANGPIAVGIGTANCNLNATFSFLQLFLGPQFGGRHVI